MTGSSAERLRTATNKGIDEICYGCINKQVSAAPARRVDKCGGMERFSAQGVVGVLRRLGFSLILYNIKGSMRRRPRSLALCCDCRIDV